MIDAIDRRLIVATQNGLPLVSQPYHAIAQDLALTADEVQGRLKKLLDSGVIRRVGAVPNHYRVGYRFNAMTVWDVPDEMVDELGRQLGELPFVTHCYRRPRRLPEWPYNLFAMLHGRDRETVLELRQVLANVLGDNVRASDILFSKRILKKTGLRLRG